MRCVVLCVTLWVAAAWQPAYCDTSAEGIAAAREALERFQLEEARGLLESALAMGERAEVLYLQSRVEILDYRYRRALEVAQRCVELFSNRSSCHEAMGEAQAFAMSEGKNRLKLARSAVAELKRAVELDAYNIRARILLIRFYELAPRMLGGGKSKALEQSQKIASLDPERGSEAYGMMYYYREEWDAALQHLGEALERRPSDGELRYHAARTLGKTGDRAGAVEELVSLVKSNPQLWEAWHTLGTWCVKYEYDDEICLWALRGFITGAVDARKKRKATAYYWMGQLRERRGELELALVAYQHALEAEPKHDESRDGVARLRRIIGS